MTDYRLMGITPNAVLPAGTYTAPTGGYLVVRAVCGDVAATNVTFRYPPAGTTPETAFALKQGCELLGATAVTTDVASHIFFFQ